MSYCILCIDEMEQVQKELEQMLADLDIQVVNVKDESEAEALLTNGAFRCDVLVRAVNHAGSDSFKGMEMLKSKDLFRHLPLVIVSEYTDIKNVIKAKELGAAEYIVKPYYSRTVYEKMSRILDKPVIKPLRNYMEDSLIIYSWSEILNKELKSSSRGHYPISIMMGSIMPQFSDSSQHQDLSELASLMAAILKTKLRDTDTPFVYKGNSFIVLLPFADKEGAETVKKKVESLFREHAMIKHRSSCCSLFIASVTCPDDGRIKEKLLDMLENEIYQQIRSAELQAPQRI